MRDKKRIKPFLKELQNIWEQVPDWRFFQLICNIQRGLGSDGFYLEDAVKAWNRRTDNV